MRSQRSLYEFSRKLATTIVLDDVLWAASYQIASTVRGKCVVLLPEREDLKLAASYPPGEELGAGDLTASRWAYQHGEAAGNGTSTLPTLIWRFEPLQTSRGTVGVMGLSGLDSSADIDSNTRRAVSALVDQTAVAIERARLDEEMSEARVMAASEKLRHVQWVGLVIAFAAVAVAFSEGLTSGGRSQLLGDAMGLAAGLAWGLTTLSIRATALATASAEKTLFYQVAVTALVAPLLSLLWGESWSLHYSGHAWVSIALQTVIGAFASYLAWMWMLRHYPATQLSSFTFLAPLFALVFGVALLGEHLTTQLVIALAAVAAGIVLVNRKKAAPRAA